MRTNEKELLEDSELFQMRFDQLNVDFIYDLSVLIARSGILMLDIETGKDTLGMMKYLDSCGALKGSRIVANEPSRLQTLDMHIDECHEMLRQTAKLGGAKLTIQNSQAEDVVTSSDKFGAIFWLKMFPLPNIGQLKTRLDLCNDHLTSRGVALLSQGLLEADELETRKFEEAASYGRDNLKLETKIIRDLGVVGTICLLARKVK